LDWAQIRAGHISQAIHNERLLAHIESTLKNEFLDWQITIIFYVCVHCMDAKLAELAISVSSHKWRKYHVATTVKGQAAVDYFRIDNESRLARYDPDYKSSTTETRVQGFRDKMKTVKAIVPIP